MIHGIKLKAKSKLLSEKMNDEYGETKQKDLVKQQKQFGECIK